MYSILISLIILLAGVICIFLYKIYSRKHKEEAKPSIEIIKEKSFESYLSNLKENIIELETNVKKRKGIIERSLGIYGR